MTPREELEQIIAAHGEGWAAQILRNASQKRARARECKGVKERLPSDKKFNEVIKNLPPEVIEELSNRIKKT